MKTVLLDASSAILLFKCGLLDVMLGAYHLRVTAAVAAELDKSGYPGAARFTELLRDNRLELIIAETTSHFDPILFQLSPSLGAGERATIIAFTQGTADFIIIDDGRGAALCRRQTLPFINALLCPRILSEAGRINTGTCRRYTKKIIALGRYSQAVIAYVRDCTRSDLGFFMP